MRKILEDCPALGALSLVILLGNSVARGASPVAALPGMLVILSITLLGMTAFRLLGVKGLPAIVYISVIGAAATSPFSPIGPYLSALVEQVDFLAIATPVLACAGIGLAKEADALKAQSGRMLIVSLFVFTGTFVGSAVVAEVLLRLLRSPLH